MSGGCREGGTLVEEDLVAVLRGTWSMNVLANVRGFRDKKYVSLTLSKRLKSFDREVWRHLELKERECGLWSLKLELLV